MILFTNNKVSPQWKVNPADIKRIAIQTAIFFAAPTLMWLAQIQGVLAHNGIAYLSDFVPNSMTVGAIEGWAIGIAINFFLKLSNSK